MTHAVLDRPQSAEGTVQVSPMVPDPQPPAQELTGWPLVAQVIREGSHKRPQTHLGGYFDHAGDGIVRSSCALGALWEGLTGRTTCSFHAPVFMQIDAICRERAGVSLFQRVMTPGCMVLLEDRVGDIIIRLNDHHRWSRERIADWIETLDS